MTASPGVPANDPSSVLPLIDDGALHLLAYDVGPEIAASFARDFARIWPRRRNALAQALGADDLPKAIDAALSLRTSSAMVGASRLAGLSEELERALRSEGFAAAARLLPAVSDCGERTVRALVPHDGLRTEDPADDDGAPEHV
ncbi:Hpt domain-containing protein [Sinomonas sp. ASV322]|uniref:Hpt domain-containing protein n=1 Tax=Sinomonas sp. ASV322 TaxID=3041920 RepID=UPI0027DBDB26|nr:Hpt domain-containing protein [Sinomonas sp. ASV322]MDQ4501863.1 Hpt domain-containing protein [Sinomonas sp. ASV322]